MSLAVSSGQTPDLPSYEEQLAAAGRFITEQNDFLVVSHVNPDGDAASSTCGLGWLLDRLGKTYVMVNADRFPRKFDYLWGADRLHVDADSPDRLQRTYTSVITIDCADYERIGSISRLVAEDAALLNIDHHPTNDRFGTVNLVKEDAAAAAEILYELIASMQLAMDYDIAVCIYTGLLTDTGGFRYANTSDKVLNIASRLLKHGVQNHVLAEQLLEKVTLPHIRLLQQALATLSFAEEGRICWMNVTLEEMQAAGATSEDCDGLINYPRNVEGVEVGLLFKHAEEGAVKVSLRSAGRVDVSAIAKRFGGGGHVRAAGCTIREPLEEAARMIVGEVGKALNEY